MDAVTERSKANQSDRSLDPVPPVPELRAFQPQYRERMLGRIATAFGLASLSELPPYFQSELVYPAEIGLAKQLAARLDLAGDQKDYSSRRTALRSFFGSFQYHQAVIQCANRMNLDLVPAGQVLPEERARSMRVLAHFKQRKSKNKEFADEVGGPFRQSLP